jgi:hypothetical protein
MAKFEIGSNVSWIKKMAAVPHPEGKTDSYGNILPVFRDSRISGRVISVGVNNTYWVRPATAESQKFKICGERYYDVRIHQDDLVLEN